TLEMADRRSWKKEEVEALIYAMEDMLVGRIGFQALNSKHGESEPRKLKGQYIKISSSSNDKLISSVSVSTLEARQRCNQTQQHHHSFGQKLSEMAGKAFKKEESYNEHTKVVTSHQTSSQCHSEKQVVKTQSHSTSQTGHANGGHSVHGVGKTSHANGGQCVTGVAKTNHANAGQCVTGVAKTSHANGGHSVHGVAKNSHANGGQCVTGVAKTSHANGGHGVHGVAKTTHANGGHSVHGVAKTGTNNCGCNGQEGHAKTHRGGERRRGGLFQKIKDAFDSDSSSDSESDDECGKRKN
ncbi:hypothetical protein Tsubulata_016393, partial [Turnera subulata]